MSFVPDPYIQLDLAGEDVDTAAWFCVNKHEIADAYAPQRRDNVPLPGVNGLLPIETFDDEQTIDLRWVMTGNVQPNGTPISDPAAGLKANKRLFVARYFRGTRDSFGCVLADVVDVDDVELGGRVQLDAPRFSEGLFECGVVMPVTIPRGELLEVGS